MQFPILLKMTTLMLVLASALTACGQKGPLYLPQPEEQAQAQTPQASESEQHSEQHSEQLQAAAP